MRGILVRIAPAAAAFLSILLALAYFVVVIKPEVEALGGAWARATREPADPPPPSHAITHPLQRITPLAITCDLPKRRVLEKLVTCFDQAWSAKFAEVEMTYRKPVEVRMVRDYAHAACSEAHYEWSGLFCSDQDVINVLVDDTFPVWNMFVLAHEYAHHVQWVGYEGGGFYDEDSRRLELQADCLGAAMLRKIVGKQVNELRHVLDEGDGDHGTAANQALWMRRGLKYGTVMACDTWTAPVEEVS